MEKERIELASLLDGEIRDPAQAEALSAKVKDDPQLKAEFEEQREIKSLLATLPEYESPDFLPTRVLGEIATQRRSYSGWLKPVSISAAALLILIFSMTSVTNLLVGNQSNEFPMEIRADDSSRVRLATFESNYTPQDWRKLTPPEGVSDEQLIDFLEFASEAHAYKRMVRYTDMMSPDMAEAIQVLDYDGGN